MLHVRLAEIAVYDPPATEEENNVLTFAVEKGVSRGFDGARASEGVVSDPTRGRNQEPDLLQRIRAGDSTALDHLLERCWTPLVTDVSRYVESVEAARDIAQEAFIRLWVRRGMLNPEGSVVAYLYHIARHMAIDERRKTQTRRRWFAKQRSLQMQASAPAESLEDEELLAQVENALQALPERRREALILVYLQELSYREAAEVMGNSPQTIANQVSAALKQLRHSLRHLIADLGDASPPSHVQRPTDR